MANATLDSSAFEIGLKKALDGMRTGAVEALGRTGERVVKQIQARAPVRTGKLRASYKSRTARKGTMAECTISTDTKYAVFVEFGTRYQSAQPHFRPGLQNVADIWASEVSKISVRT